MFEIKHDSRDGESLDEVDPNFGRAIMCVRILRVARFYDYIMLTLVLTTLPLLSSRKIDRRLLLILGALCTSVHCMVDLNNF
jgi:hypothetical protein